MGLFLIAYLLTKKEYYLVLVTQGNSPVTTTRVGTVMMVDKA